MVPTITAPWWRASKGADTALDNSRLIALIKKPRFERGFFIGFDSPIDSDGVCPAKEPARFYCQQVVLEPVDVCTPPELIVKLVHPESFAWVLVGTGAAVMI